MFLNEVKDIPGACISYIFFNDNEKNEINNYI